MSVGIIVLLWGPVLLWMGLIYFLSGIPSLDTGLGIWDWILRKAAHVFEFAVLTALFIRAFRKTWIHLKVKKIIIWSVALSIAYAVSDEFHQRFVPGRGPSAVDVLIDAAGIAIISLWTWRKGGFYQHENLIEK